MRAICRLKKQSLGIYFKNLDKEDSMVRYIVVVCLFIGLGFLTGCMQEAQKDYAKTHKSFVKNPDFAWNGIKAQILNDEAKAQKVNLLNKCYYLEDTQMCETILATFEGECDSGVGLSCAMLAVASRDARGVSRNPKQTAMYVRHGCYFQDSLSCMYMRQYYIQENQPKIAAQILESITKQCQKGGIFECFLLSLVYENDENFTQKKDMIIPYRKMACEKEFAIACAYLDTKDLSKEDYQSYQGLACELGMLAACDARRESIELGSRMQHARLYRIW